MKYSPYSFSRMNTFFSCKRKFKYSYIDKVKLPKIYSFPLSKGSFIHESIESELAEKKKPNIDNFGFSDEEKTHVEEIVEQFLDSSSFRKVKKTISVSDEYFVERGIGFDDEWNCVSYKEGTKFRGYIDFYTIKGDTAVVIDWKSGKFKERQDFTQNEIYALWIMKNHPEVKMVLLIFEYVEHEKENEKLVRESDIEKLQEKLDSKLDKIENETEFEKNVSKLCFWCDFMKEGVCDLSQEELMEIL